MQFYTVAAITSSAAFGSCDDDDPAWRVAFFGHISQGDQICDTNSAQRPRAPCRSVPSFLVHGLHRVGGSICDAIARPSAGYPTNEGCSSPSPRTLFSSKHLNQPPTSLASALPLTNLYESSKLNFVPSVSSTCSSGVSLFIRGHGTHCLTIMQRPVRPSQLGLLFANIRGNRSRILR